VAHVESRGVGDAEGQGRQCFTTLSDITARKQAENALERARDELEAQVMARTSALATAYEELKRFTYVISHDLRSPLVNLRGFARELQMACDTLQATLPAVIAHVPETQRATVREALEDDIPESLGFINAAVTRMDRLIEAVLKLAREGRRSLRFEPVDMQALVEHLLESLDYQIRQRQVRVTVGTLPQIQADVSAMHQVMGHLLSNALNYLEPGRPGVLHLAAERGPEVTTFHIRDNGRGIAAADIPKIFDIFRRVGTQDVSGEGMGLAHARTLVRRHGGDIRCESTLGVGTAFTLTIANSPPEGEGPFI
jgi:signal transduction histidine kinase